MDITVVRVGSICRSSPKIGTGAEIAIAAAVATSGKGRETGRIIDTGVIGHCASDVSVTAPARDGSQGLGYISVVTATHILVLAAHVIYQLCPLRITRDMPACWADAYNSTGIGTAGSRETHHCFPVVQITVGGNVGRVVAGIITVSRCATCTTSQFNGCTIGITCSTQVLPHPALVAYLHCVVGVIVYIGHSFYSWAATSRHKTHLLAIRRTGNIGSVSPYIIRGIGGKSREAAGEAARVTTIGGMTAAYRRVL